jgi:predicted ATPase
LQGREENYVETEAPRDATMLNRLYDTETNRLANLFKNYLKSWGYYDLSPASLRSSNHKPNEIFLTPDGNNLSSVIYRLKTSNEREYRKLLRFIRKIDPKIDLINFYGPFEKNIFMYFVDSEDHSLPAWNASAGTLRFLALAYVLLIQPPPNLLVIEEPENGIYVGFLKDLLEMVAQSSDRSQVIFTSHSPYFIDLFDNYLDSIFVLKMGKQHSTLVRPDAEKVKARLEQFPLGEQHFREMLG